MTQDVMDMPPQELEDDELPDSVPVPGALIPHLGECALLLDIDGTLLDLAPTPREVWVPPGLAKTMNRLLQRTSGALALVSGRSLNDIDLIFAPAEFPAVGGHGAEMRIMVDNEAVATHAPPMDKELKKRLAAIAQLSPGILLEDKGYSLALHYRLAPHAEKAIYAAVSLIRADLPNAPIEVLPGKCVCEIKHSGFTPWDPGSNSESRVTLGADQGKILRREPAGFSGWPALGIRFFLLTHRCGAGAAA